MILSKTTIACAYDFSALLPQHSGPVLRQLPAVTLNGAGATFPEPFISGTLMQ